VAVVDLQAEGARLGVETAKVGFMNVYGNGEEEEEDEGQEVFRAIYVEATSPSVSPTREHENDACSLSA
jgi:hypothetical protein